MSKPTSDCRATERKPPWPMVRLGDVCEVRAGASYKDVEDPNGRYPIYGTGGIMGRASQYRCPAHSVIVGRKGTLDNPFLVHEPFWNIDTCFGVVPSERIIPEYLFRFCQGFDFYSLVPASGRPSTTSDAVRAIEIPLPPLPVQREIVARLERELAAVEKMKKGFEALAETAKAGFEAERLEAHKELLNGDWPCEPLKKHVDILAGYAFRSQGFVDSGIMICGGLIIAPDRIKWEECKYWKSSKGIEQYLLQENDLVIALDRPWISGGFKIGVIGKRDLPCLLIQRTARLRMKDVDFRYVMMLLRDESFKLHCTTSGTTVPHISHKDIETYEIPFPPVRVQKEVVDRLSAAKARTEKLEAKAREGVAVCETMRKAILKEAFDSGRKG